MEIQPYDSAQLCIDEFEEPTQPVAFRRRHVRLAKHAVLPVRPDRGRIRHLQKVDDKAEHFDRIPLQLHGLQDQEPVAREMRQPAPQLPRIETFRRVRLVAVGMAEIARIGQNALFLALQPGGFRLERLREPERLQAPLTRVHVFRLVDNA